jgi:hypothetical protein
LGFEETTNVYDNSAAGFMVGHMSGSWVLFTSTDSTRVQQIGANTGQLLFNDYGNAVVVAGPLANPTTAYYEANGIAPLRGEFDFSTHTATFFCCGAGGSLVYTVDMSSLGPTNDYFLVETFQDGGHTVIVLYGINAPGTLASGVYAVSFLFPNLASFTGTAYIVHWQGTTPNVPLPSDTYTIVYPP